jgi:hypothetical protein
MKIERRDNDLIEIRLSDDPEQFKRLAEEIRKDLGGRWIEQLDDFDQSYWDLVVAGQKITVHREHYLGVSVFCSDEEANRSLLERIQSSWKDASTQ